MISKELLSEVLGEKVDEIGKVIDTTILAFRYSTHWSGINIYELAHKCKEWASAKDILIDVHMQNANSFSVSVNTKQKHTIPTSCYGVYEYYYKHSFAYSIEASTEPEAIFKAAEWIRRQK